MLNALLAVSQVSRAAGSLVELGLKLDGMTLRAALIALQDPFLAGE